MYLLVNNEENMVARIQARQSWDRARQAAFMESLTSMLPDRPANLIPFDEVRDRLRLNQKTYRGMHQINLDQIRGSVGRYRDFTRTFLPRSKHLQERWERINQLSTTQGVPPIEVYQVGEAYFVLDGNHRVSVARQNGAPTIEAYIWEFPSPVGLSAQADLDEVLIKAEYSNFLEHTKLNDLRPDAQIIFTTPGRYREIVVQIDLYQEALAQIDEQPISYEDAVTAWYDMIYTPAVMIIREQGVLERFPARTEADLFIWAWRYNQELRDREEPVQFSRIASDLANTPRFGMVGQMIRTIKNWFNPPAE